MILVINLNPSLDKIYTIEKLQYGQAMRTSQVQNTAGGKGTHVANIINILGEKCMVSGFLGGYIGNFIAGKLRKDNIRNECIRIQSETRSCLNIATSDGRETEILEPGPSVTPDERDAFLFHYKKLLQEASLVVASGSLPQNLGDDFYCLLINLAHDADKRFLLDTSGSALKKGLCARPFFIKPNKDEIEALTGRKINNLEDAVCELKNFLEAGITMPVISLGKQGSVLAYKDKIYHAVPPVLNVTNAVGSGDSYVAGLAVSLNNKMPIEETIRFASACGTANVLEPESGFIRKENVMNIKQLIKIDYL
ncbi:1-phosphofructokinase family hexose kinase [Pectinatus haikarae]|uniref:Tagatose-6-phosphate kinase n=1 Tax=Pectinatus haikarae TaxID=349096 RepID=A0ABT9Y974_9FIRM|nr:1-phosphofructokinase family hexose kinase [Pectinatus haikarae]MDQ0204395.1 tagatose 6-phosphate kinase [Pectinatus haikarae]